MSEGGLETIKPPRDVSIPSELKQIFFDRLFDSNSHCNISVFYETLENPNTTRAKINDAAAEISGFSVAADILKDETPNSPLKQRWQQLIRLLDRNSQLLNYHNIIVYLGGSILFGDPRNWDNDIVLCTEKYQQEVQRKVINKIQGDLDEKFPETMNDVVCVDFEQLIEVAKKINAADTAEFLSRKITIPLEVLYASYLITGYPLFIPETYKDTSVDQITDLREQVIKIAENCPIIGAIWVTKLTRVIEIRKERRKKLLANDS